MEKLIRCTEDDVTVVIDRAAALVVTAAALLDTVDTVEGPAGDLLEQAATAIHGALALLAGGITTEDVVTNGPSHSLRIQLPDS